MLKKLLKYDLKWCFKPLIVFYILGIFFSISVRIIESFEQSLIVLILDKICCGAVIAMIANILINYFMRNWVRFVNNIYKDESYLTHTLPVSKNQIFLSKVITSIITLFVSIIVILICFAISCLNADTWIALKVFLENSSLYFDSSVVNLLFVFIITLFFELLCIMMSGILGIIIGHKSNNFKIIKSIVIGFGVYMLSSYMSVVIVYTIGLVNPNIMQIFKEVKVSSDVIKTIMLIAITLYGIYNILFYYISIKLLNKGVNVD